MMYQFLGMSLARPAELRSLAPPPKQAPDGRAENPVQNSKVDSEKKHGQNHHHGGCLDLLPGRPGDAQGLGPDIAQEGLGLFREGTNCLEPALDSSARLPLSPGNPGFRFGFFHKS